MENSQQLSNESFSYSWLLPTKPSFELLDDSLRFSVGSEDGAAFIEMDTDCFSMRWTTAGGQGNDFGFNLQPCPQSADLVHADQIISNGHLLPLQYVTPAKTAAINPGSLDSLLSRSVSLDSSRFSRRYCELACTPVSWISSPVVSHSAKNRPVSSSCSCSSDGFSSGGNKSKVPFFSNCKKSPKKIMSKYLSFLTPLFKSVRGLRLMAASKKVGHYSASRETSQRMSFDRCCSSGPVFDFSCEKSINDAVLYCKESIGKLE